MTTGTRTATESEVDVARREMGRAQSEFYRCMTSWSVSREKHGTGRHCHKFALIYRDAIEHFLHCLDQELPSPIVRHDRQQATEYKKILSGDLAYLSKFRLARSNGTAPQESNGNAAAA